MTAVMPLRRQRETWLLVVLAVAACQPNAGLGDPYVPSENVAFAVPESVSRRLTRGEYNRTIEDLLGDTSRPALQFLPEDGSQPFDNDYTMQTVSQSLIESLEAAAQDIADRLRADSARRNQVAGCTPTGPGDSACLRQFITRFGRLALRRPLVESEITAYLTLQSYATENNPYVGNDFYTAVALVIQTILQDPEFLYRLEVGAATENASVFALSDHEIATRIAYLLWGTTPNDALLSVADAGGLTGAEARRSVAEAMLLDPRAREQVHRFHAMWLGYTALPHPAQLVDAFTRETAALIDRVVFDDRASYLDLFRAQETYVDTFLADHYGLPAPAAGADWVSYAGTGRAGILSHGSVLSAFSKFTDTSPTQRGILVRTRLLCEAVPRPPPEVDVDQPPAGTTSPCKKDRYAAHREIASCAACHDNIDPIGFGLESFDMAGRWRAHDDGLPECLIDGEGELPGYGTFNGPAELAGTLLEGGVLDACMTRHMVQYMVGRPITYRELGNLEMLSDRFRRSGHRFDDMLLDAIADPVFGLRREPE